MKTNSFSSDSRWFLRLLLALVLLLSGTVARAADAIGALAEAEGRVELNGVAVQVGAELRLGMRVTTGAESKAVLRFADDQIVALKPESVFWIKDYRYAGKPTEDRSTTELLKGGLRFISGTIAKQKPEAVQLNTPTATIGVRGTEFTVVLGSTCLLVYQGTVIVTAAGVTVVARPGQIVFVATASTPPQMVPAPELRAACDAPRKQGERTPAPTMTVGCACQSLLQTAPGHPLLSRAGGGVAAPGAGLGALNLLLTPTGIVAATVAVAAGTALLIEEARTEDPKASPP